MDRDISNWGWGQILELPDHLFGRRYCIGCQASLVFTGTDFAISSLSLPEKTVVWEVFVLLSAGSVTYGYISLALGDQLPANDGEFDRLEQVLPDIGVLSGVRRDFAVGAGSAFALGQLRLGLDTQGRRLVLRFQRTVSGTARAEVVLVVSTVPRSLPEWFV